VNVPAGKVRGQIRGFIHDAIALERAGDGQADAADHFPGKSVVFEIFADGGHPTPDDGVGAVLGIGGALEKFGGDGHAIAPDGADLGGGCTAVGADVNEFFGFHWCFFKDIRQMSVHLNQMGPQSKWQSARRAVRMNIAVRAAAAILPRTNNRL